MNSLLVEALPSPWIYCVTSDGRIFFLNEELKETTWLHPVTNQPLQSGFLYSSELPNGWEMQISADRNIYYIDHNNKKTYFEPPYQEEQNQIARSSNRSTGDFQRSSSRRKSLKQKAPVVKRNRQGLVIKRNWLYRLEGRAIKMWKKRWCLLSEFCLFIYKGPEEGETLASILLPSYTIRNCTQPSGSKRWICKIEHENMKSVSLACDDFNDFKDWIEKLNIASQGEIPLDVSSSAIGTNLTTTKSEPNIPLSVRQNSVENNFSELDSPDYAFGSKLKLKNSQSYNYDNHIIKDYDNINYDEDYNYKNELSFNNESFDNGARNFKKSLSFPEYHNNVNANTGVIVDRLNDICEQNLSGEIKNVRNFEMPAKQEINQRLQNADNDFNDLLKNAQSPDFFQNRINFDPDQEKNIAIDINRNLRQDDKYSIDHSSNMNLDPRNMSFNANSGDKFYLEPNGNFDVHPSGYQNSNKNFNINSSVNQDLKLEPNRVDMNRAINSNHDFNFTSSNEAYSIINKNNSLHNNPNVDSSINHLNYKFDFSEMQPSIPPQLSVKRGLHPDVLPPKIDPMKRVEEWTKQANMIYEPNVVNTKIEDSRFGTYEHENHGDSIKTDQNVRLNYVSSDNEYSNNYTQPSKFGYTDLERASQVQTHSNHLPTNQKLNPSAGLINEHFNKDLNKSNTKNNYNIQSHDGNPQIHLDTHPDYVKANYSDIKLLEISINLSESASQINVFEGDNNLQKGGEIKNLLSGENILDFTSLVKVSESEVHFESKNDTNKADEIIDMLIKLRKNENSLQETYYKIFGQICKQDQNSNENETLKLKLEQNQNQLMNINQAIKNLEVVLKSYGQSAEDSSKSNSRVGISQLSLNEHNDNTQSNKDLNFNSNITKQINKDVGNSYISNSNYASTNESTNNGKDLNVNAPSSKNKIINDCEKYYKDEIKTPAENIKNYNNHKNIYPLDTNKDSESNFFKDIINNHDSIGNKMLTSDDIPIINTNTHSQNISNKVTSNWPVNHNYALHPNLENNDNDKMISKEISYSYPYNNVNGSLNMSPTNYSKTIPYDNIKQTQQKNITYDINQNKYTPNAPNYNYNNFKNRNHSALINNMQGEQIESIQMNKTPSQYEVVELRIKKPQIKNMTDNVHIDKKDFYKYQSNKPYDNNGINTPWNNGISDFNKQRVYNDQNNVDYKQISSSQNFDIKDLTKSNFEPYTLGYNYKSEYDNNKNYIRDFNIMTDTHLKVNSENRKYDHGKLNVDNKFLNNDYQKKFENSKISYGEEYTNIAETNFVNSSKGIFNTITDDSTQGKIFTNREYYCESGKGNHPNKITNLNDQSLYKTANDNLGLNKFGTQSELTDYPKYNFRNRTTHLNVDNAANNFSKEANKVGLSMTTSNIGLQYNAGNDKKDDKTEMKDGNTIRRLSGFYTPRPFQKSELLANNNYSKIYLDEKLVRREPDGFEENYDIESILTYPKQITINRSENYGQRVDSDPEEHVLDESQILLRRQKSDRLKKIVAAQSLQDFSNGELTKKYGEPKDRVNDEIQRRQELLDLRQDLAYQASRISKKTYNAQ